jgi:hypothetical protein
MNDIVHIAGLADIGGEASGRIGDYSSKAYLVVGVLYDTKKVPLSIRVFVGIDEDQYWSAPNPTFTFCGGLSPCTCHALVSITQRETLGKSFTLTSSEQGGLRLSRNRSGDHVFSSINSAGCVHHNEERVVHVIGRDGQFFYQMVELFHAIQKDNKKDITRNPFRAKLVPEKIGILS